ncbi:MAG: hypothetical protein FJ290_32525 [Planctomycetes bacterium]|nr:hypothetical protein [Planctomycetota bacterium]
MGVRIDIHCHLMQADVVEREEFVKAWLGLNELPNWLMRWAVNFVTSGGGDISPVLQFVLRQILGRDAYDLVCQLKMAGKQFWPTFTMPKEAMAPMLLSSYDKDAIGLFVPLMTDFEEWLEDDPAWFMWRPSADYPQCRVEWKKQVIVENRGRIHLFAPFCPLRAAAHDIGTEVAKVVDLVENHGFIGVKLYPLMGFYPCKNVEKSKDEWLPAKHRAYGATYGRIDAALDALYAACAAREIPITAHTSPQGSRGPHGASRTDKSAANQSHPLNWAPVLADDKYPGLRLNLAHMGGDHFQTLKDSEKGTEADWAYQIARLMGERPHVYADRSCQLPPPKRERKKRKAYANRLFEVLDLNAAVPQRIMNGSDWHLCLMYGEVELEWLEANGRFAEILAPHRDVAERFFGENAADFLGLRPGGKSRERLGRFYRDRLGLAEADFPGWWHET